MPEDEDVVYSDGEPVVPDVTADDQLTLTDPCVFCEIARGWQDPPGGVTWAADHVMVFEPLNPVTGGHLLVVPSFHVADALEDAAVTGYVMEIAADTADAPCNLITSCGSDATQSVFHLHVHVVPRRKGDGLMLPWTRIGGPDDG